MLLLSSLPCHFRHSQCPSRRRRWLISAWDPTSLNNLTADAPSCATSPPSAIQLLRSRAALESLLAERIPAALAHIRHPDDSSWTSPAHTRSDGAMVLDPENLALINSLALLEYLTSGLEAALAVHNRILHALGISTGMQVAARRRQRSYLSPASDSSALTAANVPGRGSLSHEALIEHHLWLLQLDRSQRRYGPTSQDRKCRSCGASLCWEHIYGI